MNIFWCAWFTGNWTEKEWLLATEVFMTILLVWLIYNIIDIHIFAKRVVKKEMKSIDNETREETEKIFHSCLTNISLSDLPDEVKQNRYFNGLQTHIQKAIIDYKNKADNLYYHYSTKISEVFFHDVYPPLSNDDLKLIDYKLQNRQREIAFALYEFKNSLKKILSREMVPVVKNTIAEHERQVKRIKKAICKEQDTLSILGMEIPFVEAVEIIVVSGNDFDVSGIEPKSLSTVAKDADRKHWDLFCELIWKAAGHRVGNFFAIFEYDIAKGEKPGFEFLKYAADWISQAATQIERDTIDRRLQQLQKDLEQTGEIFSVSGAKAGDEEARELLKELIDKHLVSVDTALKYLNYHGNLSFNEIKKSIGAKHKQLNGASTLVSAEKRKRIFVEIHFLKQELENYLKTHCQS